MFEDIRFNDLLLEVLVIIFLVVINGVLAMSEIALVKSRKVRLRELSKKGKKGAKYALHLIRHPNRFLSTIQIGISLMGILSGVYGGAVIAAHLDLVLREVPYLAGYSMTLSYVLVVTVITYLLLVMGELIPKRVAMFNPEMTASLVSIPMVFLSRMAAPAVYILSLSTDGLLKILGVEKYKEPPPSEDEIRYLFRQGARNGTLEPSEVRLVERVLNLDDQTVGSIMTRLPDISVFRKTDSFEDMLQTAEKNNHTCYPLVEKDLTEILGVIQAKDLLTLAGAGTQDLEKISKPAVYVKQYVNALEILDRFRDSRSHMILVTDDLDKVIGLLTVNDILQAIIGHLPVADWLEEPWIIRRDDGSMLLDGKLSIEKLSQVRGMSALSEDWDEGLETLAGLVISHLDGIPISGASFSLGGYIFEVVDMDGARVDKVLVKKTGSHSELRKPK